MYSDFLLVSTHLHWYNIEIGVMNTMPYNDRIREARKSRGYTQAQLGEMIGCAKNTISSYEKGINEPSVAILNKIMSVLEVDANYIFQDENHGHCSLHASPNEMDILVKPYRLLDDSGQRLVRAVLQIELERCSTGTQAAQSQE